MLHTNLLYPRIQEIIRGMIILMALETPSLLYATIVLSELHWSSLFDDFLEINEEPGGLSQGP